MSRSLEPAKRAWAEPQIEAACETDPSFKFDACIEFAYTAAAISARAGYRADTRDGST